jgi:hypothetical protein
MAYHLSRKRLKVFSFWLITPICNKTRIVKSFKTEDSGKYIA